MSAHVGRIAAVSYLASTPGRPFASVRVDVVHEPREDNHQVVSSEVYPLPTRAKLRWQLHGLFRALGMDYPENIEVDDDTDLVVAPDLSGLPVEFSVGENGSIRITGRANATRCDACGRWAPQATRDGSGSERATGKTPRFARIPDSGPAVASDGRSDSSGEARR